MVPLAITPFTYRPMAQISKNGSNYFSINFTFSMKEAAIINDNLNYNHMDGTLKLHVPFPKNDFIRRRAIVIQSNIILSLSFKAIL